MYKSIAIKIEKHSSKTLTFPVCILRIKIGFFLQLFVMPDASSLMHLLSHSDKSSLSDKARVDTSCFMVQKDEEIFEFEKLKDVKKIIFQKD